MAPLPPNNTPRFQFEYTVNGESHDFQIRANASPVAVGSLVDVWLTALSPALFLVTLNLVSFAADGTDIFLPVTTGIEGNTYGTGDESDDVQRAWYINFIGRSAGGRRWRLAMFGIRELSADFRFLPAENADVADAITALQGASPDLLAIDGLAVTVYNYANAGVNAHWQRAIRA